MGGGGLAASPQHSTWAFSVPHSWPLQVLREEGKRPLAMWPWPVSHLLGQPPCEEGVQVLDIQPQEAFEVLPPDVVGFILLLGELRQVLRLHCVTLRRKEGS